MLIQMTGLVHRLPTPENSPSDALKAMAAPATAVLDAGVTGAEQPPQAGATHPLAAERAFGSVPG
jgi:hypothetical protein